MTLARGDDAVTDAVTVLEQHGASALHRLPSLLVIGLIRARRGDPAILEASLATVPSAAVVDSAGSAGVGGHSFVDATDFVTTDESREEATATCPAGKGAVDGGYGIDAPGGAVEVTQSVPASTVGGERAWRVVAQTTTRSPIGDAWILRAYAVCVDGQA